MVTLKLILSFAAKAIATGMGLAFGFWIVGKITGYADFYLGIALHEPEKLKAFAQHNGINPIKWAKANLPEEEPKKK